MSDTAINSDTAIQGVERYQRQVLLKDFGTTGQQKLFNAKVLVIGAGGLGCPILQYLAAAGIGTLGIVDHDIVELSNLHRQILYTVTDVGRSKASCAAEKLNLFNPDIKIIPYPIQLNNKNAASIISQFDIIIDGSDNFPTRYMVNDACVLLNKPLIYGALSTSEGQVAVFNVPDAEGIKVNYRDIFPTAPKPGEVLNCAEAGVLGVLPGIIGTMQANEAIKLIAGIGEPLINEMLIYNMYTCQSYKIRLTSANNDATANTQTSRTQTSRTPISTTPISQKVPSTLAAFVEMDYNWFCGIKAVGDEIKEISAEEFALLLKDGEHTIIDVRELDEVPLITDFKHLHLPLSELKRYIPAIDGDKVILFCQSGIRSLAAGALLAAAYPAKEYYSLKGGILRLKIK